MPYGPPDTIKKVAEIRGRRSSFLGEGLKMARIPMNVIACAGKGKRGKGEANASSGIIHSAPEMAEWLKAAVC